MYVPFFKWDIPYPKISEELHVPVFLRFIPYPNIFQEGYVPVFFWDIPYPGFSGYDMYRIFYGILNIPISLVVFIIFMKLCTVVVSSSILKQKFVYN